VSIRRVMVVSIVHRRRCGVPPAAASSPSPPGRIMWILDYADLRPLPTAMSFNQTNRVRAAVVEVVETVAMFRVRYRSV
jgi:hypothetical protein